MRVCGCSENRLDCTLSGTGSFGGLGAHTGVCAASCDRDSGACIHCSVVASAERHPVELQ